MFYQKILYFADQKHLLKLNSDLDTLFTFNSKVIEVDLVAPQNMLKILVFSKSLNSIQFLDKTLSEASTTINLDDLGVELSRAVGVSRDNNFWIFDAVNQELKKFDKNLSMISSWIPRRASKSIRSLWRIPRICSMKIQTV